MVWWDVWLLQTPGSEEVVPDRPPLPPRELDVMPDDTQSGATE